MTLHENLQIRSLKKPAWDTIGGGIQEFNTRQAGDDNGHSLCYVLQTPEEEFVGWVIGTTYWDWLYIDLMWVREDLRGQGFGRQLLALSEETARDRGAKHAYLDTFSFQAPEFYKRFGYQEFGRLEGFPAGHTRYFLTKEL